MYCHAFITQIATHFGLNLILFYMALAEVKKNLKFTYHRSYKFLCVLKKMNILHK